MKSTTCIGFSPPGRTGLTPIDLPPLQSEDLLIHTLFSGISPGTESRCLRGQQAGVGGEPCTPGYQAVGRILAKGPAAGFSVGDTVFFGRAEAVPGFINFNGTHSKQAVVRTSEALALPDGIVLPEAAMGKIAAVAYHGVERANLREEESVVVVGLGLLGQLVARIARAGGAKVTAIDRQQSRVTIAREAGVNAQISSSPLRTSTGIPDEGFDVIFDVTGSAPLINQGVELARDLMPWETPTHCGSRYVIQGSYVGDFHFDYDQAFRKELHIVVPRDHVAADLETALGLIARGSLQISDLIGTPVCPSRAQEVYDDLGSAEAARLTAVFDWSTI